MEMLFQTKSDNIKLLQEKLKLLGYGLKSDGDFGQKTLMAVNNFQKLNKIPTTNFVNDYIISLIDKDIKENEAVDIASMKKIMTLHPKIRFEVLHLFKVCDKQNLKMRIVQGYRTFEEQDALYAQGRTKAGTKVTNAKGGQSYHNYGLAIDIVLLIDKDKNGSFETASWDIKTDFDADGKSDWIEVVNIFKRYGFEWGGDWKFVDNPHFQKTFGKSINELYELHKNNKVDKNGFVLI